MITLEEMRSLALLAKLDFLSDDRLKKLQVQLNGIFQYIDKLKEVNVDLIESTPDRPSVKPNRFQEGTPTSDFDVEKFIKRSPRSSGRYIATDRVL